MLKNVAGQSIGSQVLNLNTGQAFVGPVAVFVTGDAGTQTQGVGPVQHEGNGYYSYKPSQDETNFDNVAFTFVSGNAITTTVQVQTLTVAQAAAIAAIPGTGVTAYSAIDFATRALRLLGVLDAAATPSAEDNQTAFLALNDMIDDWATQRQTVYQVKRSVFPLIAGQSTYTLGYGGDFNIVRPVWIDNTSIIPTNTGAGNTGPMEIPLGPPVDIATFQRITIKTAQSSYPQAIYWDRTWTNGLSKIEVYPVPTGHSSALVLYTPIAITEFPDMSTKLTFPPGYAKAIRYGLAMELAPEYGIPPNESIRSGFMQAFGNIKRANNAPVEAQFDTALVGVRGRYNIYTDSY